MRLKITKNFYGIEYLPDYRNEIEKELMQQHFRASVLYVCFFGVYLIVCITLKYYIFLHCFGFKESVKPFWQAAHLILILCFPYHIYITSQILRKKERILKNHLNKSSSGFSTFVTLLDVFCFPIPPIREEHEFHNVAVSLTILFGMFAVVIIMLGMCVFTSLFAEANYRTYNFLQQYNESLNSLYNLPSLIAEKTKDVFVV